ncbi:hypothetical protein NDU88_002132 [Pleurodeles waltl]|uniref:Uncharacterized protein n=1 Tax=Pleurodeles waltl TaxID=8319 RepID=A0AAV7UAD3_PLEWA|nr:hypothetical protein NDU88_002132 [Pleurodeles waltl]
MGFPDAPPVFTALEAVVGSPSPCKLVTRIYHHMQNMTPGIVGRLDVPSPLLGLLGYVRDTPLSSRRLHALLLLFAKRRVAIHWGRRRVPAVRDWLADVTYGHTQLITFWELLPAASRPRDIWDPFVGWAREHQSRESEGDILSE